MNASLEYYVLGVLAIVSLGILLTMSALVIVHLVRVGPP